jgi:hypothetical protein
MDNYDLLSDLCPEELEPRLELQVFIDPLGVLAQAVGENCCRDGGNCVTFSEPACDNTCRDGGNCGSLSAFSPLTKRLS